MVRRRISSFGFVLIASLFFLGTCQTYVFGGKAFVEKTGQTVSYSDKGGEDGDLQKGVAWPNPRFTDMGDGTVRDNLTKLIWLKDADSFGYRTWEQALSDANNLSSGSHGLTDGSQAGDWRVPNVKELQSLIDFEYVLPALSSASGKSKWTNGDAFVNVESHLYWSSTTFSSNLIYVWVVHLIDGGVEYVAKTLTLRVWPVRAGK